MEGIIKYVVNINNVECSCEGLAYLTRELYYITAIIDSLNNSQLDFIRVELLAYISLRYPHITSDKESLTKISSLKVFNLALNTIITEITIKLLDITISLLYDSNVDVVVVRRLINFVLPKLTVYLSRSIVLLSDNTNRILLQYEKYNAEKFPDYELCDPITIEYIFDRRKDEQASK
jgi:hypothetical protein